MTKAKAASRSSKKSSTPKTAKNKKSSVTAVQPSFLQKMKALPFRTRLLAASLVVLIILLIPSVLAWHNHQSVGTTNTNSQTKEDDQGSMDPGKPNGTEGTAHDHSGPKSVNGPIQKTLSPPTPIAECKSKTSNNSYHYCSITASKAEDLTVVVNFAGRNPSAQSPAFVEWFKEDQLTCTKPSDCSAAPLPASTSTTSGELVIKALMPTSMSIKAANYLNAVQCGIGCPSPVPREQYRFNGYTTNANTLTLNYLYVCTHHYTEDTNHEYPWLPNLKPTGCTAE